MPRTSRPTTRSSPRWTRCGPCAPPARRCARPRSCACACRCRELTVVTNDPEGLRAVRRHRRRRAQRQEGHRVDVGDVDEADFGISPAARRQRPRRRAAARSRRADRHPGEQVRRLVGRRRRHGHRGRPRASIEGEFELETGRTRRAGSSTTPRPPCRAVAGSSRSTPRCLPSSRSRVRPATSSEQCSRPAATPASRSRTASRSRWPVPSSSTARSPTTVTSWPARPSPSELSVAPDLDALAVGDGVAEVVVGERHHARIRVTRR